MPTTAQYKLKSCISGDFTLGMNAPPRKDIGAEHATNITRRSMAFGDGVVEKWFEVTTDPHKNNRVMNAFGSQMTDAELVSLAAAYCSDIAANAATDGGNKDWQAFIDRADYLCEEVNRRFGAESDPIVLARTMGLSNVLICHRKGDSTDSIDVQGRDHPSGGGSGGKVKRAKRGSKGLSASSRRAVRSCAVLLEEMYGLDCLSLGTCTIPPVSPSELASLCSQMPHVIRVFMQRLTRVLERSGLSKDYVAVVEIQEKRYRSWGQVYPHIHFVFQGRASRWHDWAVTPSDLRAMWSDALSLVLGRSVDCGAATRIEKPRKSLRKELGKYLTKGGKLIEDIIAAGLGDHLPSTWRYQSASLRDAEKSLRVELLGEVPRILWQNLDRYQAAGLLWYRLVEVDLVDPATGYRRKVCVGVAGRFIHDWVLTCLLEGGDPISVARSQGGSVSKVA